MARPRDPSLDVRIIDTFRSLAERDGAANVTISAVAVESGVSRPAIYRRWSSQAALMFEAQTSRSVNGGFPDLGSFRDEMIDAYLRLVDSMVTGDRELTAAQFGQIITDRRFSQEVWANRWGPDVDAMLQMWDRAATRGDVDSQSDGRRVMEDMVASCIFDVMLGHRHPGRTEAIAWVDRLISGVC